MILCKEETLWLHWLNMLLQQRQQEFTNYKDYIGMDITSLVALPVWIMMPFSMLQNISEIMEYTDRLEKAAKTEDPYERCQCSPLAYRMTCLPFPPSICSINATTTGVIQAGMGDRIYHGAISRE